jgi:hypothetical protein
VSPTVSASARPGDEPELGHSICIEATKEPLALEPARCEFRASRLARRDSRSDGHVRAFRSR